MTKALTLNELLEDPIYAKWFSQQPKLRAIGYTAPWYVYVKKKRKKPWARAEFSSYSKAHNWVMRNRQSYYDLVISAKRHQFKPPVVKYKNKKHYWPTPPKHRWCPYCRRPTLFKYFAKHHAFSGTNLKTVTTEFKRCEICGVKEDFIKHYESPLPSRWAA